MKRSSPNKRSRLSSFKVPKNAVSPERFRELTKEYTEAVQQERAAAQVSAAQLAAGRATFTESDGTREERRARTEHDALQFGLTYLPHYFENEPADFHPSMSKVVSDATITDEDIKQWRKLGIEIHRGNPLMQVSVIQVARGFAKSTIIVLCDTLRRTCYGLDPYQILISDTFAQAGSQLEDIKDELASNEKIKADFGDLKPDKGRWRSVRLFQDEEGKITWREGQIITTNKVRIDAIGQGAKMRGRRHLFQRPTCATCDDLDNDENVVTKQQRDKKWNWVISALIPAMDPKRGKVRIVGTTIHFDCVPARAERKVDSNNERIFTSIKYPAMRRGKKDSEWISNWPSRFSVEKLLAIRELLGAAKFGAEYMNDPRDPETQVFNPNDFSYYSPAELEGKNLIRIQYCDPSKGKKGKGRKKSDFSGFAEILCDQSARVTYVVNAFRKRLTPKAAKTETVNWLREGRSSQQPWEPWVEENSFGDILGETFQDELRTKGIDVTVNTLLHTTEKEARLLNHSIRVSSGGVRFPQKWEPENRRPEWFDEYDDFPLAAFDDTIDAIESADHIALEVSAGKPDFRATGEKLGSAQLSGF